MAGQAVKKETSIKAKMGWWKNTDAGRYYAKNTRKLW